MDIVTEVLSTLRVTSALFARFEATAPWGIHFAVERVVKFCLVTQGSCWLTMDDKPESIRLEKGDFFATSHGARYRIGDSPQTAAHPIEELLGPAKRPTTEAIHIGGKGTASTALLNGLIAFDDLGGVHLGELFPPLILIRQAQAEHSGFATYLHLLTKEGSSEEPGSRLIANWLGGILFVHAIRIYAASPESNQPGWIGALTDPHIATAIRVMHEQVARSWTVNELARLSGMSRSSFAVRFKELVGMPPLDYLGNWRIYLAMRAFRDSTETLAQVALTVGYESDSAFSKAFKRKTGLTPAQYRRQLKLGKTNTIALGFPAQRSSSSRPQSPVL